MSHGSQRKRATTALVIVLSTVLSIATPASASAPEAEETTAESAGGLRWTLSVMDGYNVIFRRLGTGCIDELDTVGFAALHERPGGYRLQVCATGTDVVGMRVDPADADGNSTGDIVHYSDDPYGPCCNRIIGYPVRRFQLVHLWLEDAYFSSWMPPPE